jgi:hypothetical protein
VVQRRRTSKQQNKLESQQQKAERVEEATTIHQECQIKEPTNNNINKQSTVLNVNN